jgi:NAD(P)-dependent dehydrogenase (short-subunit alcohol dehydrogenase family)
MSGLVAGKVAVVTGAARGIGREEALLLAREGARVVVNDVDGGDGSEAAAVVAEIAGAGGEAVLHAGDVSETEGAESLVAAALDTWGQLDIVVNNAGILRDRMVYNLGEDEWDAVLKVHLRGHFLVTRTAARHWREQSKAGEDVAGRIVNTTSTSGLLGNVGQANYGAAKAGVAAFTQIVAMELGRIGVTVNAISPGARTRMTEAAYGARGAADDGWDPLDPANIAPLVVYLASDAAAHITGQVFRVHGGHVELYGGWHPVAALDKDGRWEPAELAAQVDRLFDGRETRYSASAIHDPDAPSA